MRRKYIIEKNGKRAEGIIEGQNMCDCVSKLKTELREKHNAGTGHVIYWEDEPKGGKKL